jgi:molybdenum cofactor guanylyltransferase
MNRAGVTGLLLAGGRGTRMGMDKAELEFEGEPLARRVAAILAQVAPRVIVASGDGVRLGWLGLEQVSDVLPGAGPVGGLVAGLEAAHTPLVAAAAVDLPFASPPLFRLLADAWSGEDAVVPLSDRGPEPLHAVYATRAAAGLRAALDRGERSVVRTLEGLRVRTIPRRDWERVEPEGAFARNLNAPEDLLSPGRRPREG